MGENRLAQEPSLYLRQHASNPVEWWPWCEEAFAKAEAEDKPVLVSIGYSSCHWCHVMAHECFEDKYIAGLMNRLFVNIKVDREERPDIDQIYMEAVQMLNQQGGWPLNVFCLPDKRPFMGGTYFPPEDRGQGLIPWPHLLVRIAEAYKADRHELLNNAEAITGNLEYLSGSLLKVDRQWESVILEEGASTLCAALDKTYGGFGDAPKFPPSQIMGYLYAVRSLLEEEGDNSLSQEIDHSLQLCARALVRGGLYDHVVGGFFRYSIDAEWRVPHFEKMLYDNALIIEALSKIWSRSHWDGLKEPVGKTINWLLSDFQIQDGVFAATLDADSEAGEGAYYLWSAKEVDEAISDRKNAEEFCRAFAIQRDTASNPYPWAADDNTYLRLSACFPDLRRARDRRSAPVRDEKVILSWNALALRSLCLAGFLFDQTSWVEQARKGLDWLWHHLRLENDRFASVYYLERGCGGAGFLDDYVNFALANLRFGAIADWLEPGLSARYLQRGKSMIDTVLERFEDPDGEGFFFCSREAADGLIVRKKEWYDSAYPSGNSGIVHALSFLAAFEEDSRYPSALADLREAYVEKARRMPNGVAFGLEGLTWHSIGIVVIKVGRQVAIDELFAALRSRPWRPFILRIEETMKPDEIQLCVGTQCLRADCDIEEILALF